MSRLLIFGLLHCRDVDKPVNKARGLYELLNDDDAAAFEKHPRISPNDRDLKSIFEKMCIFATIDVFNFPSNKLPKNPYSKED